MNVRLLSNIGGIALCALGASCHASRAATPSDEVPPGQVWLSADQSKEAKIEIATATERSVDGTLVSSGRVSFDDLRVAHIFSPVTGRVTRIDGQLGARVKKGERLASIESPDIGSAISDVHKAQADVIAAEHDYERKKLMFEQHAAAVADLEQSEDAYRQAKAEYERAQQKTFLLRSGGASVNGAFTLTSPIDGVVVMRNINPGIEVQGQYGGGNTAVELFTVGELDVVWVFADIYEADVARVHPGASVVVSSVAYKGKAFEGKVDWVSGVLDPTSRTVRVRCTLPNPDGLLKPEMYATARIAVEERRALAIPRSAVEQMGDVSVVFVALGDGGGTARFERLPVTIDDGSSTDDWAVVERGLDAGQRVVAHGTSYLSAKL